MNTDIPLVPQKSKVLEAVIIMTKKKYGCAIIVDSKKNIKGVVTDGDLRRSMKSDLLNDDVSNIMRNNPILVNSNTLVSAAINIMNKNAITSLIISENKKAIGIQVDSKKYYANYVISNMDVVPTYNKLLKGQKKPNIVLNQERSSSAVIFYWGIKHSFPNLDLHNIFFANDYKNELYCHLVQLYHVPIDS